LSAYFDPGVLVKAYCAEPDSAAAAALIQAELTPLPLTHFQESELRITLRLKVFRREVSVEESQKALANLDEDISRERFFRPAYLLAHVFLRAEALSAHHTSLLGARILDLLHVAAALELKATKFISFDQRQRAIAKRAKLKVLP